MPRISLSSLRSRAILLVLLAILPLLALTLYSYFDQRARAIVEVQRDELVASRNLATVMETLIKGTRQLLASLTQMSQVQRHDPRPCESIFTGILEKSPYYALIIAADSEGRVFASAPRVQGPLNIANRKIFQKAIQTRDFVVGEPMLGTVSGKYNVNVAYPIMGDQGQFKGVVVAGVDLDWLGSLLAKNDFSPDTALVLSDSSGQVLFRYPEPLKYVGRMMPYPLIKAMAVQQEGVAEGVGLPGDARLFAFARISPPWQNLHVSIGLPKDWALARVNHDLWRNLIWLGLVGLLALAAAWYGSGLFIVQPARKLRVFAERLAEGDLTARAGPDYPGGELGHLAYAFDQMADAIQERNTRLKHAAGELEQRVLDLDRRTRQLEAANKEMEAFTYTVSHDLRAPLRAIGGFARVLLEDYPDKLDADGQRYLHIIHQNARKMGQLIDDLLALTRLGRKELSLSPIDMTELVMAVFEELTAPYPGRKPQIEVQPLPEAQGDRVMIRQLLANLLGNAIKFTKGRDPALIQVRGWSEAHDYVYCVKDNGVGFDMKYGNKLFEVFQRLHLEEEFAGTGMGLAIVKRIVDRHGGRVWAEGKVGEGADFCFTIPKNNGT